MSTSSILDPLSDDLKEVISQFARSPEGDFTDALCKSLLEDDVAEAVMNGDTEADDNDNTATDTNGAAFIASSTSNATNAVEPWCGLPPKPYFKEIARVMVLWGTEHRFPVELPQLYLLNDSEDVSIRMEETTGDVVNLITRYHVMFSTERERLIGTLLRRWGLIGVQRMLRVRRTVGTAPCLPPGRNMLLSSFRQRHTVDGKSVLSVGARALAKHSHRCSDGWWGSFTGPEKHKNDVADTLVKKILDECVWINAHGLPHEVYVVEFRVRDGYGARWLSDGTQFRGFLEPMMEGGHEKGWRH